MGILMVSHSDSLMLLQSWVRSTNPDWPSWCLSCCGVVGIIDGVYMDSTRGFNSLNGRMFRDDAGCVMGNLSWQILAF